MRRAALLCVALWGLAGCAWTLDGDAPDLPLVGAPPSLGSLQRLNRGPVYGSAIVHGVDGAYWLSLQEESKKLRVVRLSEPAAEMSIEGDQFVVAWRAFYVWKKGDPPTDPNAPWPATLELISAGQDSSLAQTFPFDLGIGQVIIGGADDVFVYVPQTADATGYEIVRRADGLRRSIAFPGMDQNPSSFSGGFFSGDGDWFFDRAPCITGCATDSNDQDLGGTERRPVSAHGTTQERDLDLGALPRRLLLYEPSATTRRLLTCGSDGVNVVPLEPSDANPALQLESAACASDVFSVQRVKQDDGSSDVEVYYSIGGELRRVPIDASRPPERVLDHDVARVLAIYDQDTIIYSQDPGDRYIYGVGDGWIGDWRFMNRGRSADLSADRKEVRFLENAAQSGGIGDLCAAPIGGDVVRLARNTYQYDELDDGRVLAAANHAFRGTQNRIIVIDEKLKQARWVVDQAARYSFIPGSSDLLVDIVTGASSSDLVRVSVPDKQQ
jgi:hypothetical protein